jgi:hypothetical protein
MRKARTMIYDWFSSARKMGTAKLAADVEDPSKSDVFKNYPKFF